MNEALIPVTVVVEDRGTVIVVDDDHGLRDTLCDLLSISGVQAFSAKCAAEALTLCTEVSPDVVILDQRLPDSPGLELASALRASYPLLPLILLTGYASENTAIAAVGVVDDYLTKPVSPPELIRVVSTRIEQHRLRLANQSLLAELTNANARLEQTVEQRTHELRMARDEALEASTLKSEFLTNVSHELRTPLNAIIGFSDLMQRVPSVDGQSTVPTEWIGYIQRSGKHLLDLINDILDLAKVESGKLVLQLDTVHLEQVVADAVASLKPLILAKSIEVDVSVQSASVVADQTRIRQILDNLLSNAIKFTPDAGRITVRAAVVGDHALMTVADSGIGIAPEDQEKIFEQFHQLGDPDLYRAGTGLGLPLARSLAHAHGGSITVQSERDSGSTFTVRIPVNPEVSAGQEGAPR